MKRVNITLENNSRTKSIKTRILRIEAGEIIIDASRDIEVGSQLHAFQRPENIALSKTSAQSSIRNYLQGRVTEVWTLGTLVGVKIDCAFLFNALITRQSAEEMGILPGVQVYAQFKASSVHVLR